MDQQLEIAFPNGWGGRRAGAGRKRNKHRSCVPRRARAEFPSSFPVHVTVKLRAGLPAMRRLAARRVVREIFRETNAAGLVRIAHFSVQHDHVHLLVECDGKRALGLGMKSLNTKLARRLNRLWRRTGPLLRDRYHHSVLETPTEVRNALRYVLRNGQHHGVWGETHDPHSSSASFDGWSHAPAPASRRARKRRLQLRRQNHLEALSPETWLLREGWKLGHDRPTA